MDLTFDEYQKLALQTLQGAPGEEKSILIALLGLAGETGELLTLYKKFLRDGAAYEPIRERLAEELGDVMWYVSSISSHFKLDLADIAHQNIRKTQSRWLPSDPEGFISFDEASPESERLPRLFTAEFRNSGPLHRKQLEVYVDGQKFGSTLTDNSYKGDDYRYHDILHLAFAAILGWSPVLRALLHRKRKSDTIVDEVEDGGRAVAIEEGLAALIFNYAQEHSLLLLVDRLDWRLLKTCREMTAHLEVSKRSLHDWEEAIIAAFRVWRAMQLHDGGSVRCDLTTRRLDYLDAANEPSILAAE